MSQGQGVFKCFFTDNEVTEIESMLEKGRKLGIHRAPIITDAYNAQKWIVYFQQRPSKGTVEECYPCLNDKPKLVVIIKLKKEEEDSSTPKVAAEPVYTPLPSKESMLQILADWGASNPIYRVWGCREQGGIRL